jgi:predicted nuclease of predicted toxin-antitoxin system
MKILIDEQLNRRMKMALADFDVYSTKDLGWSGLQNGELREKLNENSFYFLITADKNMPFQQNFNRINFKILLLDIVDLVWINEQQFVPKIINFLQNPPETPHKLILVSVEGLSNGRKNESLKNYLGENQILFV